MVKLFSQKMLRTTKEQNENLWKLQNRRQTLRSQMISFAIGMDIGTKGSICFLPRGGTPIFEDMPYDGKHLVLRKVIDTVLHHWSAIDIACVPPVAFESLCSFGQGRQSAFNFGGSYHCAWNAVSLLGLPLVEVKPSVWKNLILPGLPHNGPDGKAAAVAYVSRRWPAAELIRPRCREPDDNRADAACLAEYALRKSLST